MKSELDKKKTQDKSKIKATFKEKKKSAFSSLQQHV